MKRFRNFLDQLLVLLIDTTGSAKHCYGQRQTPLIVPKKNLLVSQCYLWLMLAPLSVPSLKSKTRIFYKIEVQSQKDRYRRRAIQQQILNQRPPPNRLLQIKHDLKIFFALVFFGERKKEKIIFGQRRREIFNKIFGNGEVRAGNVLV